MRDGTQTCLRSEEEMDKTDQTRKLQDKGEMRMNNQMMNGDESDRTPSRNACKQDIAAKERVMGQGFNSMSNTPCSSYLEMLKSFDQPIADLRWNCPYRQIVLELVEGRDVACIGI